MAEHEAHASSSPEKEHPHPGAKEYLGIAVLLTVITAVEVAVYYVPALRPMLVPVLLTLSTLKFALVAMFYMHLKFDHRLFSWLFVTPMCVMAFIVLALLKLFGQW